MEDTLINFETAKLAKEKGFNIPVINYINPNGTADCIKPTTYYGRDGINELGGQQLIDYNNTIIDIYELETHLLYYNEEGKQENYSAPTQSLLQKWLREVHNIHLRPDLPWIKNGWKIDGFCLLSGEEIFSINKYKKYKSYEEVLEIGLQEALKLIK